MDSPIVDCYNCVLLTVTSSTELRNPYASSLGNVGVSYPSRIPNRVSDHGIHTQIAHISFPSTDIHLNYSETHPKTAFHDNVGTQDGARFQSTGMSNSRYYQLGLYVIFVLYHWHTSE